MIVRPAVGRAFAPACTVPAGYLLDELFVEGTATAYSLRDGATYDRSGVWDAVPSRTAPFRSRHLVVRPVDPAGFGGTVLVNWQNVTRGFETGAPPEDLAALGLAWVGVSAERVV